MNNNVFSYEDYLYLYEHYDVDELDDIVKKIGKSSMQIIAKARKLGLRGTKEFTPQHMQAAKYYGKTLGTALIFLFPELTVPEVKELLQCNGIKVS